MLRTLKAVHNFAIHASDGEIGRIEDFYFDDEQWVVRYLVVKTGGWLFGKEVLISPRSVTRVEFEDHCVAVNLTRDQVRNSPDIDTDKPISRQKESEYHLYYNFPVYWGGMGLWGRDMLPVEDEAAESEKPEPDKETHNTHLRSANEICGYRVHAVDGDSGHVDDLVVEEETWAVRYMVLDTGNWLPGKKVLISPKWVDQMVWAKSKVNVNTSLDKIKFAPDFDPKQDITREYEEKLFEYYEMHKYWEEE